MTTPDPGGAPAPAAAAPSPAPAAPSPAPAAPSPGGDPTPPASGAPAAGQVPPASGGPSPAYRPEGLPDHLLGKDDRDTLDKVSKAYAGARDAIAKFGSVPDAPEKYAFAPAEAVAPYLPNVAEDPAFKAAQAAAHKHGLGDKQFAGFVNDFMAGLIGGQMLEDPFSADKERAIIAPDVSDPGERAKAAAKASSDTVAFLDAMQQQGRIDQATADWAKGRTDRGHFLKLMSAMRAGAPGIEMGGQNGAADVTKADLEKRHADPRQKSDPTFQAETNRLYQHLYPEDPGRA